MSFDPGGMDQWEPKVFSGETTYEVVSIEGLSALRARSNDSASGLVLKKRIDLHKTPYMNWSWRISRAFPVLDEQNKVGDDYVARVYVVFEDGFMGLGTKAINYVWSSQLGVGKVWNNAFAGLNVKMVSVQDRRSQTDKWYYEKRNVYTDMIHYFGDKGSDLANMEAYRYADVIAIMTDTDNSHLTADSYYGVIKFSVE
ncbi:hypothetical protein CI610_01027 [invertebrate metagenome]|uniref:DUF3047 domain-containing protein n=1 Tax=invertebrate metagenome TaxID=1711999 RepID=A0A2H9T9X1_9ZZZZ